MREDILQALSELIKEKTELKAEKVELGMVDDLISDSKKLTTRFDKAVKNHMAIAKLVNENFKEMASLVKSAKKGYGFVQKVDKQFKELGVKPTKEYKNATQKIYDVAEGSGEQMLKDLAKFKGLL